jgi:zinc ribbon protein
VICPKCRTTVPDQSAFCMACGARLTPSLTPRDGNGAGTAPVPVTVPAEGTARVAIAPGGPAASAQVPPGTKQAYALSFGPLADERLRYRVARWVVDRAPAHALTEVQDDLAHGTFLTFLALTAAEAEVAREGIHGLGVAPPLLRLAPATTAQMLLPERRRSKPKEEGGLRLGSWRTLVAAAIGLLLFGLVVLRLIGGSGF